MNATNGGNNNNNNNNNPHHATFHYYNHHPMERVLFNLHHQVCTAGLRHSSSRLRSWLEKCLLFLAVCGFGALLLVHVTFVHRTTHINNNNIMVAVHNNHSNTLSPKLLSIPAKCLKSVPGFTYEAHVTHLYLLEDEDDDDDKEASMQSFALTEWPSNDNKFVMHQDNSSNHDDWSCPTTQSEDDHKDKTKLLHKSPGYCDTGSEPKTPHKSPGYCDTPCTTKSQQNQSKPLHKSPGYCDTIAARHERNDNTTTATTTTNSQQNRSMKMMPQHHFPSAAVWYLSYSRNKGHLLLAAAPSGSPPDQHLISVQHVFIAKNDLNCFGEPFLQKLVFGLIGVETVMLNWCLAMHQDAVSYRHHAREQATTATARGNPFHYYQDSRGYQADSDEEEDDEDSAPGFVYNAQTDMLLELRPIGMAASAQQKAGAGGERRRTSSSAHPQRSYYYDDTAASRQRHKQRQRRKQRQQTYNIHQQQQQQHQHQRRRHGKNAEASYSSPLASYFYGIQLAGSKLHVVLKTCFLYFITTTLVSFTLRETQERMLDFTQQLQTHVRNRRPVTRLVTRHFVDNLVFVPIMVGMIFFLIEFYSGDKILAFLVLTIVWFFEVFSVISVRSYPGLHFFPKIFFLLFALLHFYIFSFPFGFTYTALASTACFMMHSMLFFWHRFELPAVVLGQVTPENPRMYHLHRYHHHASNMQQHPQGGGSGAFYASPPTLTQSQQRLVSGTSAAETTTTATATPTTTTLLPDDQQQRSAAFLLGNNSPTTTVSGSFRPDTAAAASWQPPVTADVPTTCLAPTPTQQHHNRPPPSLLQQQLQSQRNGATESAVAAVSQQQQQQQLHVSPRTLTRRITSRQSLQRIPSCNTNSSHGGGMGLNLSRQTSSTGLFHHGELEDDGSYMYFMGGEVVMHRPRGGGESSRNNNNNHNNASVTPVQAQSRQLNGASVSPFWQHYPPATTTQPNSLMKKDPSSSLGMHISSSSLAGSEHSKLRDRRGIPDHVLAGPGATDGGSSDHEFPRTSRSNHESNATTTSLDPLKVTTAADVDQEQQSFLNQQQVTPTSAAGHSDKPPPPLTSSLGSNGNNKHSSNSNHGISHSVVTPIRDNRGVGGSDAGMIIHPGDPRVVEAPPFPGGPSIAAAAGGGGRLSREKEGQDESGGVGGGGQKDEDQGS